MVSIIGIWFQEVLARVQEDVLFAVIGGIIILFAQALNAAIGIWRSEKEDREFSLKYLLATFFREITFTLFVIGGIIIIYMVEELASMTLVPGFNVGDVPAAALLIAYGENIVEKAKSIYFNLMFIMTGEDIEQDNNDMDPPEEED